MDYEINHLGRYGYKNAGPVPFNADFGKWFTVMALNVIKTPEIVLKYVGFHLLKTLETTIAIYSTDKDGKIEDVGKKPAINGPIASSWDFGKLTFGLVPIGQVGYTLDFNVFDIRIHNTARIPWASASLEMRLTIRCHVLNKTFSFMYHDIELEYNETLSYHILGALGGNPGNRPPPSSNDNQHRPNPNPGGAGPGGGTNPGMP